MTSFPCAAQSVIGFAHVLVVLVMIASGCSLLTLMRFSGQVARASQSWTPALAGISFL